MITFISYKLEFKVIIIQVLYISKNDTLYIDIKQDLKIMEYQLHILSTNLNYFYFLTFSLYFNCFLILNNY